METLSTITIFLLIGNLLYFTRSEEFEAFSMAKVNVVWKKAQMKLEGKELSDLYADLLIQDKKEKELKKRKFEGTDKDGLYEAEVRESFMDILINHGLANHFSSERYGNKRLPGRKIDIRDEKLKKMLKSARKEGFTDNELGILKEEMSHYQTKMDEYESMKQEYESLEEQVDNSLDNLDDQEKVWKNLAQKKKDMKMRHKEIRDGIAKLGGKVADKDNKAGKFEDARVYHLWALAQKSGMSEEELDTYRKELTHFENRIRKVKFVEDQIDKAERKLKNGEDVDRSEHLELKAHAKKIQQKVDKHHTDLKQKVQRRLDEL